MEVIRQVLARTLELVHFHSNDANPLINFNIEPNHVVKIVNYAAHLLDPRLTDCRVFVDAEAREDRDGDKYSAPARRNIERQKHESQDEADRAA